MVWDSFVQVPPPHVPIASYVLHREEPYADHPCSSRCQFSITVGIYPGIRVGASASGVASNPIGELYGVEVRIFIFGQSLAGIPYFVGIWWGQK